MKTRGIIARGTTDFAAYPMLATIDGGSVLFFYSLSAFILFICGCSGFVFFFFGVEAVHGGFHAVGGPDGDGFGGFGEGGVRSAVFGFRRRVRGRNFFGGRGRGGSTPMRRRW